MYVCVCVCAKDLRSSIHSSHPYLPKRQIDFRLAQSSLMFQVKSARISPHVMLLPSIFHIPHIPSNSLNFDNYQYLFDVAHFRLHNNSI